jgi:hypothetical protein
MANQERYSIVYSGDEGKFVTMCFVTLREAREQVRYWRSLPCGAPYISGNAINNLNTGRQHSL